MKRLFVITIVLSVTSMAHSGILLGVEAQYDLEEIYISKGYAATFSILLDGEKNPTVDSSTGMPTDGSTLLASGNFKIQIRDILGGAGSFLDTTNIEFPSLHSTIDDAGQFVEFSTTTGLFSVGLDFWEDGYSVFDSDDDYVNMTGGNSAQNAIGSLLIMDGLEWVGGFHGIVSIDLIASSDIVYYTWSVTGDPFFGYTCEVDETFVLYETGQLIDKVRVYYNIPEPMSIFLLIFGTLFLRRRK